MTKLERWTQAASAKLLALATVMLLLIVAINALNVIGRYVFGYAFGWSEEIMLYLMIASVFFAFADVTLKRDHIRMDIVVRMLPVPLQRGFSVLGNCVLLGCFAVVVAFGSPIVWKLYEFGQTSVAAEIKVYIPQLAVPFGLAAAGLFLLFKISSWGNDFEASTSQENVDL
jgi:TRAP-type C4-dicarboxylate transport system permease small subunit